MERPVNLHSGVPCGQKRTEVLVRAALKSLGTLREVSRERPHIVRRCLQETSSAETGGERLTSVQRLATDFTAREGAGLLSGAGNVCQMGGSDDRAAL